MSLAGCSLPTMGDAATIKLYPFRYRDARTRRWIKARYRATMADIAASYAEWELTGPGEVRRPCNGYFKPVGREVE